MLWGPRGNFNDVVMSYHVLLYIRPWNRIGPYLIGILVGYYLATIMAHKNKKSTTFVLIGWMLSLFAIFGAYPAIQVKKI
jgi:hypothetical protein